MDYIDQSGLYAFEDVLKELEASQVKVLLVGLKKQPKYMMQKIDVIPDVISDNQIFDSFEEAVKQI